MIEVREAEGQVIVYLPGPWPVPPDRWDAAAAVIVRLNAALPVGSLALDQDGDWHARASVDLEGVELSDPAFERLMRSLVEACDAVHLQGLERIAAAVDGDDPGPLP